MSDGVWMVDGMGMSDDVWMVYGVMVSDDVCEVDGVVCVDGASMMMLTLMMVMVCVRWRPE